MTRAVLTQDGGDWVVRPAEARLGDFEVRYRTAGGDASIEGTIRGTAMDMLSILLFPNPARVAIAGNTADAPASVSGTVVAGRTPAIFGTVEGVIEYVDDQGGTTACDSADIFLVPTDR